MQETAGPAKHPPYRAAAMELLVCDPQAGTATFCARAVLARLCSGCNIPGLMTGQLLH